VGLALLEVAVQRDPRARGQQQAGEQDAGRAADACSVAGVARVHRRLRKGQDCCRNSCCTPSDVRLATFEVSCDWNRNWWHCIVISSICPGVISVALADMARESDSMFFAVPLRLSNALTIILAETDSPGGAVLETASAPLPGL